MEFIKRMKKREFIEMALKTAIAIFASFIAIILMEGMIYGIEMNALRKARTSTIKIENQTVAYCVAEKNDYFVIYYNENQEYPWTKEAKNLTKEECEALLTGSEPIKAVLFRAPNAFEFTITPVHYVIMVVFVLVVAGYFVYRFVALTKEYKKIVDDFNKTGKIEITNN